MTYLPRASIIRLPPGTIKLVPICLRNPTSNIIKKKTDKVPSRIQKILHLVSGTTRFHSNNSDSIFVNEKRFLRLFWFCFGFFLGFFFLVFKARRLRNRFGFAGRTWWCHLQCRCPRPRCRRRWPPCRVGSAADSGRSVKTQKNRFNRLHFDDFLYFFQSIRWKHVRVAGFHGNESDRIFTAVIRIKQFRFYRFVLPSFFYWVLPSFEKFSLKNPILEPVLLVLFFLFFEIEFCQCNLRFYRIDLICWKTEPVLLFIYLFIFFWVSELCWFLLHRFYAVPLSRYRCVASYRTSHWSVSADAATRIWPRFLIFMFFINLPSFFKNNFVFASASRTPGLTMGDRINTRPRFYVFFLLFLPKKREIKNFYSFVVAAVVAVVAAVVVRFAHFRP